MSKGREYEVYFKLGADMDTSIKKALGTTEKSLGDIERELRGISASDPFKKIGKSASGTKNDIQDLDTATGSFKDKLRTVAEYVGAFALLEQSSAAVLGVFSSMTQQEAAFDQIQAATGLTAKEMANVEKTVNDLYLDGLGEGFAELSAAVATTRQATQAQGEELDNLSRKALIYKDVFGDEVNESVRSADILMRQFGLTADEAYNLMAQGSQKGLNKTGELLDTINEFSPQFSVLGFSAQEMFDFFAAGLDSGAWNLDKVGDLVKEFDNRLKDAGDKANREALADLFAPPDLDASVKKLITGSEKTSEYLQLVAATSKETAAQLVKDLKAGGTKGEKAMKTLQSALGDSEKMLAGISNGSIRGADAMQLILTKLAAIEDPIERQTLGIAILGTQYEDLGQNVVNSLGTVNQQFDQSKATMDEIAKIKYDNFAMDWRTLGRELLQEFVVPLSEDLLPVLREFTAWATDNKDLIRNMILIFGGAAAAKGVVNLGKSFGGMAKAATEAATVSGKAGIAVKGIGIASGLLGGPVGIGITAISAITTGVMEFKRQQDRTRDSLLNMGVDIEKAYGEYQAVEEHQRKMDGLILEYDNLKKAISDSKTPTEDLEAARKRLLEVEQELIDLNPDILQAEDAKTGKLREQAGILQDIAKAETESAKRNLEATVFDNNEKFGDFEKEYDRMQREQAKMQQAFEEARDTRNLFAPFESQRNEIVNNRSLSQEAITEELNKLARQVAEATGEEYWNIQHRIGSYVAETYAEASKAVQDLNESLNETEADIETANGSLAAMYNTELAYIQRNLSGPIEEVSKQFDNMTDEEKRFLNEAIDKAIELNEKFDQLPEHLKLNVDVIYNEINKISTPPDFMLAKGKTSTANKLPALPQKPFWGMDQFADGGFANRASIFGEAGLEAAIPIDNRPQSHALLDRVNEMMGHDTGGSMQVTFAPVINLQGGGPETAAEVKTVIDGERQRFERWFKDMMRNERRLAFK